jgi:hypothetical protein
VDPNSLQHDERCAGEWAGGSTAEDRASIGAGGSNWMWDTPARFFKLFFDNGMFEVLAQNTNAYAQARAAGGDIARGWRETNAAELLIFVGLIIYMGVFRSSQVSTAGLQPVSEQALNVFR